MVIATAFLLALVLALTLTPLGIRVAWATGYLDHPEARKLHTSATALLGGAIVFACALAAWILAGTISGSGTGLLDEGWRSLYVAGGAVLALGLGLWDDRFGMEPRLKSLGQATAAALLLASGHIPDLGLPVYLNAAIAIFALVAMMNAVNFLDNMNGIVGGLAAIALAGFAWHSLDRGATGLAAAQLAVAGACVGYLPHNFPRAKLFLGDAGSLFLGYCLGASALIAFDESPMGWGRAGVFLVLGYPTFDLFFVVITRIRDGRKVYEGGKDHTNHRLASILKCQKTTVLLVWLSGVALCASGLAVLRLNQPLPSLLLSALWIILFLAGGMRLSSVPVLRPKPAVPPAGTPTPTMSA
jgi:UDP-GlcNAc:undecaprenyl-phosphate GlcNAc-1-phosphate transferase